LEASQQAAQLAERPAAKPASCLDAGGFSGSEADADSMRQQPTSNSPSCRLMGPGVATGSSRWSWLPLPTGVSRSAATGGSGRRRTTAAARLPEPPRLAGPAARQGRLGNHWQGQQQGKVLAGSGGGSGGDGPMPQARQRRSAAGPCFDERIMPLLALGIPHRGLWFKPVSAGSSSECKRVPSLTLAVPGSHGTAVNCGRLHDDRINLLVTVLRCASCSQASVGADPP
jgi:hypothetical protein